MDEPGIEVVIEELKVLAEEKNETEQENIESGEKRVAHQQTLVQKKKVKAPVHACNNQTSELVDA